MRAGFFARLSENLEKRIRDQKILRKAANMNLRVFRNVAYEWTMCMAAHDGDLSIEK